jgi:hypothetical protein
MNFHDGHTTLGPSVASDIDAGWEVTKTVSPVVAYCVEDGCRNEATASRLIETFTPVVVNGTEVDQTVELVCEDHT